MVFCYFIATPKNERACIVSTMKTSSARIVTLAFIFITAYHASASTPSSEQILPKTVAVNRHLLTVEGLLNTTAFDDRFDEEKLETTEQIHIDGIGSFRSERYTPSGKDILIQNGRKAFAEIHESSNVNIRRLETVFPLIYFHNSVDSPMDNLHYLGFDTRIVVFDRAYDTVAFAIGTGDTENPGGTLWIDKKQGFPLKFIGIGTVEGECISLRVDYLDYTRVKQRFRLPTRINYYINDKLLTTRTFQKVSINQPIANSFFETADDSNSCIPLAHFITARD